MNMPISQVVPSHQATRIDDRANDPEQRGLASLEQLNKVARQVGPTRGIINPPKSWTDGTTFVQTTPFHPKDFLISDEYEGHPKYTVSLMENGKTKVTTADGRSVTVDGDLEFSKDKNDTMLIKVGGKALEDLFN